MDNLYYVVLHYYVLFINIQDISTALIIMKLQKHTNQPYFIALPKAIIEGFGIKSTDRLRVELYNHDSFNVGLRVRIVRNSLKSYSTIRKTARVFLKTGNVRLLGWTSGIGLSAIFTDSSDVIQVRPSDRDWRPAEITVTDTTPRHPRTDRPLTPEQALRQKAKDAFQCSTPSEAMIKAKMEELRQEDKVACVTPEFHDLNLPGIDKPAPTKKPESTQRTRDELMRTYKNNLLWGIPG